MLALYLHKKNIIKFIMNNFPQFELSIACDKKYIELSADTKFLGLQIENRVNWKTHIYQMIPWLYEVYYAVRSVFCTRNTELSKQFIFNTIKL
jgi:hypothetical protein